jgi:hypothetical protein
MQSMEIGELIENFFLRAPEESRSIESERALQLELAYFFRMSGVSVQFERGISAPVPHGSNRKSKRYLDLLVHHNGLAVAIELKVPLSGRHPETMYDFCADIEYVESIVRAGYANSGYCLMFTNDKAFWDDSGRGSPIHDLFRRKGPIANGRIDKPTGERDSCVVLTGSYGLSGGWRMVGDQRLMKNARYLPIQILPVRSA